MTLLNSYREAADPAIADVVARSCVPVLAGGTMYYVQSLLWETLSNDQSTETTPAKGDDPAVPGGAASEDAMMPPVSSAASQSSSASSVSSTATASSTSTASSSLTDQALYQRLKEVDPGMAQRLHPNDVRRVQRSLEIFDSTGRRHSDVLAQQKRAPR